MTQLPEWIEKREASKRTFWEDARKTFDENLEYAIRSLQAYTQDYPKWQITYSGGKDSSAVLGLVIHAIESEQIKAPEQLTILYADTQRELPPLHITAMQTLKVCEQRGYKTVIVTAPIEKNLLCAGARAWLAIPNQSAALVYAGAKERPDGCLSEQCGRINAVPDRRS